MGINGVRFSMMINYFFGIDRLNIGQILRLTSFAQDDHVGVMTFYKGDCSWEGSATDVNMNACCRTPYG